MQQDSESPQCDTPALAARTPLRTMGRSISEYSVPTQSARLSAKINDLFYAFGFTAFELKLALLWLMVCHGCVRRWSPKSFLGMYDMELVDVQANLQVATLQSRSKLKDSCALSLHAGYHDDAWVMLLLLTAVATSLQNQGLMAMMVS